MALRFQVANRNPSTLPCICIPFDAIKIGWHLMIPVYARSKKRDTPED